MARKKSSKKVGKKSGKKSTAKSVSAKSGAKPAEPEATGGDKSMSPARRAAGERIGEVAASMLQTIDSGRRPSLRVPIRGLSNTVYNRKRGHFQIGQRTSKRTLSFQTVKTFAQSVRMMAFSKELIERDDIATKREVYYVAKGGWGECKFQDQPESDTVMDDMEAMLGLNREVMGFVPAEHGGEVAGELTVIDTDPATGGRVRIDCTAFGSGAYSVPSSVEDLEFETKAKFVLAIETQGMFTRLVKHAFFRTANCVLVSMGGVPSRACRRFIRKLSDDRNLPVYVFTDGDPYGYCNIYRTLKVGSGNSAHLNEFFCVPRARFLGVTPQDITDYHLDTHPLGEQDRKRAEDALKNDPFITSHKEWETALKQMLKMGCRVEQQAFAGHGLNFVLETYLPQRLREKRKMLP